MKESKRIKIIFFLVILLIFLVTFSILRVYREMQYRNSFYTYDGPGGTFYFEKIVNEDLEQHIVTVYSIEFDNLEHEKRIPLHYSPYELEEIPFERNLTSKLIMDGGKQKKELYITQDPELPIITDRESILAVLEIIKVTGQAEYGVYKIYSKLAYTEVLNDSEISIMKTCKSASNQVGVIELRLGNNGTKIYSEGDCVILEADNNEDFMKLADKLIYIFLGVF